MSLGSNKYSRLHPHRSAKLHSYNPDKPPRLEDLHLGKSRMEGDHCDMQIYKGPYKYFFYVC